MEYLKVYKAAFSDEEDMRRWVRSSEGRRKALDAACDQGRAARAVNALMKDGA